MIERLDAGVGSDELRQLNQRFPERYPFLLQSTSPGGKLGRYDILFAFPGDSLLLEGGELGGTAADFRSPFLQALDRWWLREQSGADRNQSDSDSSDTELPFRGGWFLYLGYELAGEVEQSLALHTDPLLPTAFAVRCPAAVIYDHAKEQSFLLCETKNAADSAQLRRDLARLSQQLAEERAAAVHVIEEDPQRYLAAVRSAKQHIAAGDVYQANLSREWAATVTADLSASQIYDALCRSNPAPFAGIVRWRQTSIISSSPERLLSVRRGEMSTRPIAGTRPRGGSDSADEGLSSELFAHPKERAEHVMLIDLERNDLGRVCKAGTVEVDEMMVLESYAHVHHIVSNVRGQLRDEVTPGAAIAAVFPGGTITGCPKVRCMEIINELEDAPRGAYTGSFGYLNLDGDMDLNILIRTMVKQGDQLSFRAGSGIVADSHPEAELDETRAKAEGLLRALR